MKTMPPGEYSLIGPNNEIIFKGGLNQAMELWPGTQARRQAAEDMYKMEQHKQDAEAQLAKAQDQALKLARVANDLISRCEAYVSNCEAREQERHDAEEAEAAARAEEQEAERLAAIAAELAPIIGPDGEQPSKEDDGELTVKHAPDPEQHGYPAGDPETEDDQAVKPVLSYGKVPLS
jgi:hypothetical protein